MKWISGTSNPVDALTKSKASTALKQLIDTNIVQIETVEWVEQTEMEGREGMEVKEGLVSSRDLGESSLRH